MAIYDRDLEFQKLRAAKQGQWMDSMAAFGNFMNQRQELQQNAPYKEAEAAKATAMAKYYGSGGSSNSMVPLISGFDPQTGSPIISGMVPKGTQFSPDFKSKNSPSLVKAKDERVAGLIQMSEENPLKLSKLDEADSFLGTLPKFLQGRSGAISYKAMLEADPTNPYLGQWQNLKSVLMDAQLEYMDKMKGAYSDKDMRALGQAVANDDLVSVARMKPQIQKLKDSILSRQNAALRSYEQIYKEDPSEFVSFDYGDKKKTSKSGSSKYTLVQ